MKGTKNASFAKALAALALAFVAVVVLLMCVSPQESETAATGESAGQSASDASLAGRVRGLFGGTSPASEDALMDAVSGEPAGVGGDSSAPPAPDSSRAAEGTGSGTPGAGGSGAGDAGGNPASERQETPSTPGAGGDIELPPLPI